MKTHNVTIRRNPHGVAELFFYNANPREYWLECYNPFEGHTEVSESYMLQCKPLPVDMSARAIAEHWERIGPDRASVRILNRLPRPVRTENGWRL